MMQSLGITDAMWLQGLLRSYRPFAAFVMQIRHDGTLFETFYGAGDVRTWFEEHFGHTKRPVPGAWYEIPIGEAESPYLSRVLFNAHAFAEYEFDRIGLDPRQKPAVPRMLPNIGEMLAARGHRCEICFEPWGTGVECESPLMHDWETCCRHFACRACWGRLQSRRCPWCRWNIADFLKEITATAVAPVEPACARDEPEDAEHSRPMEQIGWVRVGFETLRAKFTYEPVECNCFYIELDGVPVALGNPFYGMDENEITDESCRLWAVDSPVDSADVVLSRLAWLFGGATKLRRV